jgi:hypothetical protein
VTSPWDSDASFFHPGNFTPPLSPRRVSEADPHEIRNLAGSPEHREVLDRLRAVLDRWIEETGDQGRVLEPPDLAARKGVTKTGTEPNRGYALERQAEDKASGKAAGKKAGTGK